MNSLKQIKSPIQNEVKEFDKKFKAILENKVPLLNTITDYVYRRKGKQIRPVFVLLSAKMHGEINESSYTAATMIELLHTATLIHDDVIDDSYERRGVFSIGALWKSKIAVLVGDYLLAQGLLVSVKTKNYNFLEVLSESVQEMSEGELIQLKKTRRLNLTEDEYFEIIRKKTASLIRACTVAGSLSVTQDPEIIETMRLIGENIGIAFQIKDDLLDYERNSKTGKPKGNDIKEKKLTLPLIHSLSNSSKQDKKQIIKLINDSHGTSDAVLKILDFVESTGGISYATDMMNSYKTKTDALISKFPKTDASEALMQLVEFIITRNK